MKEVFGNVFIGNREDGMSCLTGEKEGVKRILTVDSEPLCAFNQVNVVLKYVFCLDEPEANLLSHFDSCIEFIQEGLKESKVLVHWYTPIDLVKLCSNRITTRLAKSTRQSAFQRNLSWAGISRSATIILAFLMQTQNIELNKALEDLKAVYPTADPNPGFMYQLQLFEAMSKKVDTSSTLYKQFRLQIIAKQLEKTGCKPLPSNILESLASDSDTSSPVVGLKEKTFKCRKCRQQLFKSSNSLTHEPGTGQDFLPWYSRTLVQEDQMINRGNCTSYFIEPVKWMMPLLIGTSQGKLTCPKCSGKIGSFNWAGEQCSCGRWITPAFQLHKSKIDER